MKTDLEIGTTGIKVFPLGLGGMPLSIANRPDEAQAIQVIHTAIDHGINFIDTADAYCLDDSEIGHNERLIAKALKDRPDKHSIHIASKGGCTRPDGSWGVDRSPQHLRKAVEKSLNSLGVDSIFLYQLHAASGSLPYEDSIAELDKLKKEGKIQHIGISNVSTQHLEIAQKITRIESVQNEMNLFVKANIENGLVTMCLKQGVTFIPYAPVGGHNRHHDLNQTSLLQEIAKKHQVSSYQVCLAWCYAQGPHMLPIPGASKRENILSSIASLKLALSSEEIEQLNQIVSKA